MIVSSQISPALPVESGLPSAYQSSVTSTRRVKVPTPEYRTLSEKLTVTTQPLALRACWCGGHTDYGQKIVIESGSPALL